MGPAFTMKVYPGDTVKMEVFAKWEGPTTNTYSGVVPGIATVIANSFGNPAVQEGGQLLSEVLEGLPKATSLFASGSQTEPRAYLNYLVFDNDYLLDFHGFTPITNNSNGVAAPPRLSGHASHYQQRGIYLCLCSQ